MDAALLASTTLATEPLGLVKRVAPVVLLALFWCWETWRPFFGNRDGRWRHAGRNLALALVNTAVLGLTFGVLTVRVAEWTARTGSGVLNAVDLAGPARLVLAVVLLDGWMYLWHRANHAVPLLWRFHRLHHSDPHMDVTTATRFHLGEHVGSAVLRLGLVPLLGLRVEELLVYETLVVAVTQFHHADISLGRWDRWLRMLVVTPDMHKVHHSDWQPETDSNYATVLSIWDRLAGTFRVRPDLRTLVFGLRGWNDPVWQGWWGLWKTPFADPPSAPTLPPAPELDDAQRRIRMAAALPPAGVPTPPAARPNGS